MYELRDLLFPLFNLKIKKKIIIIIIKEIKRGELKVHSSSLIDNTIHRDLE
jgi:hypothetical protein